MKVSIIIPVFNAEKTIKRTLDSLLMQTMSDFEVILVDDDSTDHSADICQHYGLADSRFHYIKQPKNMGPAAARNTGMTQMQGSYVTFIDSDDTVDKDYLKVLLDAANESDADIVWCNFQYIYETTGSTQKVSHDQSGMLKQQEFFYCFLNDCPGIGSMWNKCYKAAFLKQHQLRIDENRVYGEDWDFNMSACLSNARVFAIKDSLYNYFKYSGNSVSSKYHPSDYNSYCISHEQLIKGIQKFNINYPLNKLRGRFLYNIISLLYKLAHSTLSKKTKKEEFNRIAHGGLFYKILHTGNWSRSYLTTRQYITIILLRLKLDGLVWQILQR